MTDIERARQRKELRDALAKSIRLTNSPCPACGVSWSLHDIESVVRCAESAYVNNKEGA